jgi:hypothetical protein
VAAAAYAHPGLPLGGTTFRGGIEIPGRVLPGDSAAVVRWVTAGYHQALGLAITAGRSFDSRERMLDRPPMVVTELAVREFFAGADPLGETVVMRGTAYVVVGVAADVRQHPESPPVPELHVPLWAGSGPRGPSGQLMVRTEGSPEALLPMVRRAVASVLPDQPLRAVGTMERTLMRTTAWRRFDMWLIGLFGTLGLVIATIGLYGSMAYAVERRVREIGVRMALGAAPRAVIRLVVVEAAGLVIAGLAVGALAAWWATAGVRGYLGDVIDVRDPASFLAAAAVLTVAAVLAGSVPSWRAVRVDPALTLRAE